MSTIVWLIPIFPALAALTNGLFGEKYFRERAGRIAVGAMALSFLLSVICLISLFIQGYEHPIVNQDYYTWIGAGNLAIPFGIYIDSLTVCMMLVVSFVGTIIFIYALGYMQDDPGYVRFFTYMPLFTFFMFLLVMGNSLPLLFVGWEGVGLCSYLLIGYYYDRDYAADAGKKAFIVNRIGDFGFLLGMLLLFWLTGTLKFNELFARVPQVFSYSGAPITLITLLLFIGATGKSAQIPLYVWLPDAMAGPTPVSALIHAATMVTAGVYMVVRLNLLFSMAPVTLLVVGAVGGLTALWAASMALVQRDSKKILAYSTISQLGYMFIACGCGAYIVAIFHLVTHAFFKACLFLGAGSVLHAFHRTTDVDVFEAGGLSAKMPYTRWTFFISTLAIAGIPPLAGFFSKDEILWEAFSTGRLFLWFLGITTAFCTAFYMFRLYNLLFAGKFRGTEEQYHHLHESSALMWIPLAVLAFFAITAGWLNIPLLGFSGFHNFLHPVVSHSSNLSITGQITESSHTWEAVLALVSVLTALAGIFFARLFYVWTPLAAERMQEVFTPAYEILWNKYYVDEIYDRAVVQNYLRLCRWAQWFDDRMIVRGLNQLAAVVVWISDSVRIVQTGKVPHYALATLAGAVFLIVWLLICYH